MSMRISMATCMPGRHTAMAMTTAGIMDHIITIIPTTSTETTVDMACRLCLLSDGRWRGLVCSAEQHQQPDRHDMGNGEKNGG